VGNKTRAVTGPPTLEELVRTHHERLVRLAYLLCGDPAEAEDVVADAYAKCWPRLARRDVDDPLAYLRRAVVNGVRSWQRRRYLVRREERRRRVGPDPSAPTSQVDDHSALIAAVRQLPLGQRQVLALRFLEDLSEQETAATLQVSVGTVKSRTARGLDALRHVLSIEQPTPGSSDHPHETDPVPGPPDAGHRATRQRAPDRRPRPSGPPSGTPDPGERASDPTRPPGDGAVRPASLPGEPGTTKRTRRLDDRP